jgi:hypothetical protein
MILAPVDKPDNGDKIAGGAHEFALKAPAVRR